MLDVAALLSVGLAFFVVAVSPGPATLSNATIAMHYGRKPSFVYGLGLSTGLVFWGVVAASGMGAVLQASLHVLMGLKVLGGLYLLWLALRSARAAWTPDANDQAPVASRNLFVRGLVLNLSNPKSVVAWMAALSIGLDADDGLPAVLAATAVCIVVGFAVNALYTVVFSMPGMMRGYRRCRRWVSGAVAAVFAVAGAGLIRSAFNP